jgi:Undecaprenyl-phosphate glucose phosphotransferase
MNETGWVLRKAIESDFLMGYKFVGFVSDENTEFPNWIGNTNELETLLSKHHIEMLFVTYSMFSHDEKLTEYFRICTSRGIHLRLVPEDQHWDKTRLNRVLPERLVVINPQVVPMDSFIARVSKRLFDIVFSGLIIILIFSWLFPLIAIIIKLSSKGPIFFVQKRTGINNRIFNCIKFRSMYVNDLSDRMQATKNDSRITPIGRFMRKTNLDEMPQFFNVFLGQMSVVGPRPHMLKHTHEFSELIKFYLIRHYVRPGITGWAQVNGFRGITDELWKLEKRVEYDMQYIEGWNFWWDIKIILMTVFSKKIYWNAG